MPQPNNLSTWVEIKRSALLHNLQVFRKIAHKGAKICPILKSNAYGHNILKCAKLLQNKPIWGFGVVNLEEAVLLRNFGLKKPILVLSYVNNDLDLGIRKNIAFSIYSLPFAKRLNRLGAFLKKKVAVHLKIDVGTSRLGILPKQVIGFLNELKKLNNLKIEGIFAHLADSENYDWTFTQKQLNLFNNIISKTEKADFKFPLKHIACSAAALGSNETHFNLIRPGISLYGLWPSPACRRRTEKKYPWLKLKPALSWQTKIIQIKNLSKGTSIGYGCSYKTKKSIKLAVLPVGYWEGYDRHLSNKGEVLIKGKRVPVLGRVCMNMLMVDLSHIKGVRVGDRVTLIGKQGKEEITADELAEKIGTINYEVVTRINPLIPRIYV